MPESAPETLQKLLGGIFMSSADIGLIGLAVMGSNLALNIAEKGYTIAVNNRTASKIDDFMVVAKEQGLDGKVVPEADIKAFIQSVKRPRSIIIMVKAGTAGRRDDRTTAAAAREGRRHPRMRQFALHRHPAPLRLPQAQGHRLSRHRRVRRRRGRAARPLDHGRRRRGSSGRTPSRSSRRSRPSSTASRAAPISAKAAPAISSRPSTTASNMATCR